MQPQARVSGIQAHARLTRTEVREAQQGFGPSMAVLRAWAGQRRAAKDNSDHPGAWCPIPRRPVRGPGWQELVGNTGFEPLAVVPQHTASWAEWHL